MRIICNENCQYEVAGGETGEESRGPVLPLEERGRERAGQAGPAMADNFIRVDRLFLVLSPILFLIFNILYWLSYCRNCFESK